MFLKWFKVFSRYNIIVQMETIHAESNVVATSDPEKKRRGRKPTVYFNNKPIDPKYHVNYYHDVTKKRDYLCPYCNKKFARPYNVTRHLEQSNKTCASKHLLTKHPELEGEVDHIYDVMAEGDSDSESTEEWSRRYSIHSQPPIPDNPFINRWLDRMREQPEPRTQNDWMNAGMLMVQMMLESQKNKE